MTSASINGILSVQRQLDLLALPPQKRRRALGQIGREIKKHTRKNIRSQKDIYGRSFTARSDKAKAEKKRRKLLRRMGKKLTQRTEANEVTVSFKGKAASIAYKHHHGHTTTVTKERFQRERDQSGQSVRADQSASTEQARVLIKDLGYRRPIGKNKTTRASQRWIKTNMTVWQAGVIIRSMRDAQGDTGAGDSWTVEIPARAFFGGTRAWVSDTARDIIARATTEQLSN